MIIIIGLIILIAAVVAGVAARPRQQRQRACARSIARSLGHHVTGTIGTPSLDGIVASGRSAYSGGSLLLAWRAPLLPPRAAQRARGRKESGSQTAESRRETAADRRGPRRTCSTSATPPAPTRRATWRTARPATHPSHRRPDRHAARIAGQPAPMSLPVRPRNDSRKAPP